MLAEIFYNKKSALAWDFFILAVFILKYFFSG